MKEEFKNSEERQQSFFRDLFKEQQENENREREKDRKMLLDLAKIIKNNQN